MKYLIAIACVAVTAASGYYLIDAYRDSVAKAEAAKSESYYRTCQQLAAAWKLNSPEEKLWRALKCKENTGL